ncbi:SRPBCC family protein [Ideonella sp. A 288]|uniref:SRPBCC family protein n=1 Tax=Ideonella sp. A 288 TaxID=1962181 RepID=UPI000B4A73C0|nr:SRPBCC family protein [Ideonella sp. A 288]
MLKTIGLVIAAAVAALLGFAATRPDSFEVQRRTSIQAPPDKVFALLDDFHRFPEWSPWEKLDPGMTRTHGGSPRGVGATYEWSGNDQVGAGRMEITGVQAPAQVTVKLDFLRPFESRNTTVYTLRPKGGGTEVTWSMSGPMPFVSKLMSVFVSMDAMIGKDFEAGLANLKALAEK